MHNSESFFPHCQGSFVLIRKKKKIRPIEIAGENVKACIAPLVYMWLSKICINVCLPEASHFVFCDL
nr:hypothetical protein CFP56_54636 [Quercus suber]